MEELKKIINDIFSEEIIKLVISNKSNKDVKYNKINIGYKMIVKLKLINGNIEVFNTDKYVLSLDVSDLEGTYHIFAGVCGFSEEQFNEYINNTGNIDTLTGTEGSITASLTDFRIISGDVIATYTAGA